MRLLIVSRLMALSPTFARVLSSHSAEQKASLASHCRAPAGPSEAPALYASQDPTRSFCTMSPDPAMSSTPGLIRRKKSVLGVTKQSQCLRSSPGATSGSLLMLHDAVASVLPCSGSMTSQDLLLGAPQRILPWQLQSPH
eukprot:CAMPEP_0115516180 /NCGR_PEP_ID=MMETSP0271-20121206/76625_1 /TAXON_ID=71861 /ORGANISM="Scrippsiella trochoidea, Strain CCMP3099" /LENGTH=139 /DNA_ID=CAMNT_0002946827 /DNA_START=68 /DNA_END=487 /DNA_ORIENTATION=-